MAKKTANVVYCGPTIVGVTKKYTVYASGLPPALQEKVNECKELEQLVVAVEELPTAMRQLKDKNSRMYRLYQSAERKI